MTIADDRAAFTTALRELAEPVMCEMTGPHQQGPAPAVVRMPGGTKLCADCAVLVTQQRLAHQDAVSFEWLTPAAEVTP
jgi:hypothetical protein